MERREFTIAAVRTLLGGATLMIVGCGHDSVTGPTAAPPAAGPVASDAIGTISSNHQHIAMITAAQLIDGGGLNLDIRGAATHSHMVTLTESEIASIRQGVQVQKESSVTSHSHTVIFNA